MANEDVPVDRPGVNWNRRMFITGLFALCVSLVGLWAVWSQLKHATKATEALVIQSLTTQSIDLLSAAMEQPGATRLLFPVLDPPSSTPTPDDRSKPTPNDGLRAELLARSLLCHFEAVLGQEHLMSDEQRDSFRAMMSLLFAISPMLHVIVEDKNNPPDLYSPRLHQIAQENPAAPVPTGDITRTPDSPSVGSSGREAGSPE